jgi:hypothetical protein
MRYIYIKYSYSEVFSGTSLSSHLDPDKEREVLSYVISDDIDSLNLNSNPGSSPYANWIHGGEDGKMVFGLYLDTQKIKKIKKPITWIINMMNQCIRDEKIKILIK